MFQTKQTKKSNVNQFVQFQLSQQQARKVKGGNDDSSDIGEDIIIIDDLID